MQMCLLVCNGFVHFIFFVTMPSPRRCVILILLCHHFAKKDDDTDTDDEPYIHSRYRKTYYRALCRIERRRRQRSIPRPSLHSPHACAWQDLYAARQDQALITLTGVDFATLDWLAEKFQDLYDKYSPWIDETDGKIKVIPNTKKGRPRMMTALDCLALCLVWTRTRGSWMIVEIVFGMTANPVSMYLRFGRRILIAILVKEPDAGIKMPSLETIQDMKDAIRQ